MVIFFQDREDGGKNKLQGEFKNSISDTLRMEYYCRCWVNGWLYESGIEERAHHMHIKLLFQAQVEKPQLRKV